MSNLRQIEFFIREEYAEIITNSNILEGKIRFYVIDGSYIDIWFSKVFEGRFSFHWERKDGKLYRLDNVPHKKWEFVSTFPYHFHDGEPDNVVANPFANQPEKALRAFMDFVRNKIEK